ncbi:MAG TPA: LacI family DNA-binding transcriptional regulator, partial [Micromonosporaceae bacterium]|nr:LacI family DNA-binding transcriptional regulator [Micromonosporaceae bacterium]
ARRPAVMMDVARLAGVSHQTVSRVLNDHPSVRPETRARVLAAMRELDYQPNSAARTLVTNRSQTLGLVTFDTTLVGPSFMVYAVERAAREAGYFVSIASARSMETRSVAEAIRRLREQAVEAIITIAPLDSALAALEEVPGNMPLVGMGVGDAAGVAMVGLDNVAGAAVATRHLLGMGHRTVHHIAGPDGWPEARERRQGWEAALAAGGVPVPEPSVGDWSARSGYEAGRALADDPSVTAVFCANDQTAIGVLRALAEAGRRVPGDVSVVGFDDIPEAPYLSPPLTTVVQDFAQLGRRCVEVALHQIATGVRTSDQVRVAPRLAARASAAAPPH